MMLIGFSFGRCLRDVVKGDVPVTDIVMIQCRTRMETRERMIEVVKAYMDRYDYLFGLNEEECITTAVHMWNLGLLHQPRLVGDPAELGFWGPAHIVWMTLAPPADLTNPTVLSAYEHYLTAVRMATPEKVLNDDF